MADDTTNQDDQFQTNDPDDTNPLADMQQDQKLPEDHDPPFSPPDGIQDRIGDTHQAADTNVDPHERYDAGIEEAADVEPPSETKVNEYDPFKSTTEDDAT